MVLLIGYGTGKNKKKLMVLDPREQRPIIYLSKMEFVAYCKDDYQSRVEFILVDWND